MCELGGSFFALKRHCFLPPKPTAKTHSVLLYFQSSICVTDLFPDGFAELEVFCWIVFSGCLADFVGSAGVRAVGSGGGVPLLLSPSLLAWLPLSWGWPGLFFCFSVLWPPGPHRGWAGRRRWQHVSLFSSCFSLCRADPPFPPRFFWLFSLTLSLHCV